MHTAEAAPSKTRGYDSTRRVSSERRHRNQDSKSSSLVPKRSSVGAVSDGVLSLSDGADDDRAKGGVGSEAEGSGPPPAAAAGDVGGESRGAAGPGVATNARAELLNDRSAVDRKRPPRTARDLCHRLRSEEEERGDTIAYGGSLFMRGLDLLNMWG